MIKNVFVERTTHNSWPWMVSVEEGGGLITKFFANRPLAYKFAEKHAKRLGVTIKVGGYNAIHRSEVK